MIGVVKLRTQSLFHRKLRIGVLGHAKTFVCALLLSAQRLGQMLAKRAAQFD